MASHVFGRCAVAGFVPSSVLTRTLMQLPHVPSPFWPPGWFVNQAPTTSRYHGTLWIESLAPCSPTYPPPASIYPLNAASSLAFNASASVELLGFVPSTGEAGGGYV